MKSEHAPPTQVRYVVLLVSFLASVLLYLDRFCMNYAQRYVKEDLGMDDDQLSWCMFGFFLAYALAQVPSGWLCDRFGPRRMMTLYILIWSVFTGLMGAVSGFIGLLTVRVLAGFGQAGAYPTCASVVRRWMPISARGMGSSFIAFGGRVGGGIAPILTAVLIVAFVPLSSSPLLTPADLLDAQALHPKATTSAESALTDAVTQQRLSYAAAIAEDFPETDDVTQLVTELNAKITGPLLLTAEDLRNQPLEAEAQRMLAAESLSEQQRRRTNRLILEMLFPAAIRKIYVHGWRAVMVVFGLLGLPVALLFWSMVRDTPLQHPFANEAEADFIGQISRPAQRQAFPLVPILTSRSLWLLSISQFGTNIGWAFLVTWLPRYLLEVHRVPFETRGLMLSIPLWCGWGGMLFGGWMTDRLVRSHGIRWGRALPLGWTRLAAGAMFLLVALLEPSAWMAVGCFAAIAFLTDSAAAAVWAVNQDVGGQYTAAVLGWGNMWGNIGAAVSPLLIHRLVKEYGNWEGAFLACAVAFMIAGLCGTFVDAREQVAE